MENYDVLYLEDDPNQRMYVERNMVRKNIPFISCESLNELSDKLVDNNYKIFLLDGRFPEVKSERIQFNFPKAVSLIKEKYENPKIILYSSEMNGQEMADECGAEFCDKGDYYAEEIVEKLEKILLAED